MDEGFWSARSAKDAVATVEIRHLQYFLAVVDEGGVNKAAAALHVAQPSLSQALRKFEKSLGTQLFHRVGRGLVLAPAGEALIGPARTILRDIADAENAVREIRAARRGRVDVATLSDVSTEPLSSWIAQFRARHPEVTFRVSEHETVASIVQAVQQGSSEIGMLPHPIGTDSELVERFVVRQQFVAVLPPGPDTGSSGPLPVGDLRDVPLVIGEPEGTTASYISAFLRDNGVEPLVAVEVPQGGAVMPTVVLGGGAAIVPLRLAIEARNHGAVVRELDPPLTRNLGMIHRSGRISEATIEFLGVANDLLAQWYGSLERHRIEGKDLVEAATLTVDAIHRNVRARGEIKTSADQ